MSFAEGWDERHPWMFDSMCVCAEANVLHTWERTAIDAEALGIDAGSRIENSFGTTQRRHLARVGHFAEKFDPRFGW